MAYNTLRIGGLASGLDIEQIVKDLVKVERIPLDKVRQNRQIWTWKQEDYRAMNTALAGLRDQVFKMKLQSTYLAHKAGVSDETVASATAGTSAAEGTYSLEISQLAKGVQVMSSSALPEEKAGDGTTKNLAAQLGLVADQDVAFTVKGAKKSDGTYAAATINLNTSSDNIYTLVSQINAAKDADGTSLGLQASYDATYNRVVVVSKKTGASQHFEIAADATVDLEEGGTASLWADKLKITGSYDGLDAKFKIAGSANWLESSSNTVSILGMTIDLKKENASVTINITRDTDGIFNSIKSFVEKYNETLDKVNTKLKEERYRDYLPLTEEQKKEMKDKDVELWEEKARSGMLRNDPILRDILGNLRTSITGAVDGLPSNMNNLSAIGITTGSYWEGGKLNINEDKLRKAIADNPEGVMALFTQTDGTQNEPAAHKGLAMRLYDDLNRGINRLSDHAGSTSGFSLVDNSYIGKELKRYDQRIKQMEDRLAQAEDRYWKKFTALEKAISQMNSQSAWLTQQFGGGQGGY